MRCMVSITQTYFVIKLCPLFLSILRCFLCKRMTRVRQTVAEVENDFNYAYFDLGVRL